MTTTHPDRSPRAIFAAAETGEYVRALSELRDELLALPDHAIHQPAGNVAELLCAVLEFVDDRRAVPGGHEQIELDHLERVARALARAELQHLFRAPRRRAIADYGAIVTRAGERFDELDAIVTTLVRRGVVRRRDVPRRRVRDLDDRCAEAIDIVTFVEENDDGDTPRAVLRCIERVAHLLLGASPAQPERDCPTALRDRAYSLLRTAFDAARSASDPTRIRSELICSAAA